VVESVVVIEYLDGVWGAAAAAEVLLGLYMAEREKMSKGRPTLEDEA
jgi:hypothetical protein